MNRVVQWLRHEMGLRLVSLAIALVLVAWRANVANPIESRWYTSLEVSTTGLREGLLLVTTPRNVTVVLRGPRRTLDALSREHLVKPKIDLSGLHQPTWSTLPVSVDLPAGVEKIEISPKEQLIELDAEERRSRRVRVELTAGGAGQGYRAEEPALGFRSAQVIGPRRAVSRVHSLLAMIDVVGARDTVSGESRLYPVDAAGLRVTGVTCTPASVSYTVQIRPIEGTRQLKVVPRLQGAPASVYRVVEVTCQPATVELSGPEPTLIDLADRVQTVALDVTNWKQTASRVVPLELPQGVTARPNQVTVRVELGVPAGQPAPAPTE